MIGATALVACIDKELGRQKDMISVGAIKAIKLVVAIIGCCQVRIGTKASTGIRVITDQGIVVGSR
jgi:hypothetical protein